MASRRVGNLNSGGDNGMVVRLGLHRPLVRAIRPVLEADYQPSNFDTRADDHSPQGEIDLERDGHAFLHSAPQGAWRSGFLRNTEIPPEQ